MIGERKSNKKILETSHVFIDTSIFVQKHYHFSSHLFGQLINLTRAGKIFIHLTQVTASEIESNILSDIKGAKAALQQCRDKTRVLRSIEKSIDEIFDSFDVDQVSSELTDRFREFCNEAHVDMVSLHDESVERVFGRYFSAQPPFGEAKKKHEFPDAFAIDALREWCRASEEKMYVISSDADMIFACQGDEFLIPLTQLEELLNLAALEDEVTAALAVDLLQAHLKEVADEVRKKFNWMGFYVKDKYGKVHDVKTISVDVLEDLLTHVSEQRAYFTLTAGVEYTATVSYFNMSGPVVMWQSITPELEDSITVDLKRRVTVPVEVEISFINLRDPKTSKLVSVQIKDREIGVIVDEDKYGQSHTSSESQKASSGKLERKPIVRKKR